MAKEKSSEPKPQQPVKEAPKPSRDGSSSPCKKSDYPAHVEPNLPWPKKK